MSPRSAVAEAPTTGGLDLAGLGAHPKPQVNLLPPEVHSRRALGRTKVRLALGLGIFVIVLALGWAYAAWTAATAADELAFQQSESARLTAEQAQYSEVPRVKNAITRAQEAREFGTSTEVLYSDLLTEIKSVRPETWSYMSITTQMPTPVEPAAAPVNPLLGAGVGTLAITGRAVTVPDVSAWQEAIETIPGITDSFATTAKITDEDGSVFYAVSATVQVDESRFAHRFVQQEEAK